MLLSLIDTYPQSYESISRFITYYKCFNIFHMWLYDNGNLNRGKDQKAHL
jgi:hypothetical protein